MSTWKFAVDQKQRQVQGTGFFPECDCNSGEDPATNSMDTVFVSSALLRCEVWHVSDFAGKTSSLAISASAFDRIKLSQIEVTLAGARGKKWGDRISSSTFLGSDFVQKLSADQVTISNATEQLRTSSRVVVIEGALFDHPFLTVDSEPKPESEIRFYQQAMDLSPFFKKYGAD